MVIQGAVYRMMMLGKRAAIRYAVTDMGEEGGAPRWGGRPNSGQLVRGKLDSLQ